MDKEEVGICGRQPSWATTTQKLKFEVRRIKSQHNLEIRKPKPILGESFMRMWRTPQHADHVRSNAFQWTIKRTMDFEQYGWTEHLQIVGSLENTTNLNLRSCCSLSDGSPDKNESTTFRVCWFGEIFVVEKEWLLGPKWRSHGI